MKSTRRAALKGLVAGAMTAAVAPLTFASAEHAPYDLIVDTHQHLWDLSKQRVAWLDKAADPMRRRHGTEEYLEAMKGFNVRAIYMEVDVEPALKVAEAEGVVELCRSKRGPTVAAVIGGRPDSVGFEEYVKRFMQAGFVRGVRQVLHSGSTPPGLCLKDDFVKGIRFLGKQGLSFDLCMRTPELKDGLKLTELAPETRFVVDHCGNADPTAFIKPGDAPNPLPHDPDLWRRDMELLAKRPNVICKISGIVARAPEEWSGEMLAPIVNHCLDTFGPDRVVFGGDWPICLRRATLAAWIEALKQITASRPLEHRRKLWAENAKTFYALEG